MSLLKLQADCEIKAAEADKPAPVEILAYNGGLMIVPGYGPVVIDLSGLQLSASVVLLSDHDASRRGVVGSGTAQVKNFRLFVNGSVSRKSEAGREIIELHQDGVAWQASIGVQPTKIRQIRAGETIHVNGKTITAPATGFKLVEAGIFRETTITALGCDAETSVAIAASQNRRGKTMTFENWAEQSGFSVETMTDGQRTNLQAMYDRAHGSGDAISEERERINKIHVSCSGQWGAHQTTVDRLQAQAIAGEIPLHELQSNLLSLMRSSRPAAPSGHPGTGDGLSRKHIEACLLLRAGHDDLAIREFGETLVSQSAEIRGTSLPELCAMALRVDGQPVPRSRDAMLRAALSTTSLPVAFGNSVNRAVIASYRESPASWRSFASIKSANNFKPHSSIMPSLTGDLAEVGEGGNISHASLDETVFQWSISTFAKILSLSRNKIIDDDLGFLTETAPAMGKAALRKLSDVIWDKIMSNSSSFFASGNANLLTSGSALSVGSLGAGITAMRKQRDSEGRDIDISPRVLCVPPDLESTARGILNSMELLPDSSGPTGNPLREAVSLEVESRLSNTDRFSGASATAWYLFASPADIPFVVGFLDGQESPNIEFHGLDADIEKLAVSWRIYHDWGAEFGDYRAGLKATGAA
ncbi:MAG: Mu-like prophage major head subunit gpT family protein [Planctomycetaceae bacterium]|nr:Mu-like prophage major head subunit gpT family protein [Planctomycetaceae bacterium]